MVKEIIYAGASIAGWTVQSVEELPDVAGRLVMMEYGKNGAQLAWLDRDDDNMTFAIVFRTIPVDDTGVAHILEHSVLCGSKKYPVKEPFVDLLKGSFATFLNAWTAPDHTAYPVCSRNKADFLNLMDVYLDAVLHPLSVENPVAFLQEGWHYELDGEGRLKRNGVVYSEMKGEYSNPMRIAATEAEKLLFAGSAYGFDSGGDPAAIPQLDFDKYRAFYRRHYHPSNARVFLDGKADVEAVLARLDSFFKEYGRLETDTGVPAQKPAVSSKTVKYPVAAGEPAKDKTILADAWLCGRFDELEKREAATILCEALAGSNEEPLAKELLSRGLCDNVALMYSCAMEGSALLLVQNAADGKEEEIRGTVRRTFEKLAAGGLDHARLKAIIDREEFEYRERDYGKRPRGLVYLCSALDQWLYGGDPAAAFKCGGIFASLRRKVDEGWFEKLLGEIFIDNRGHASVTLVPDAALAAENEKKERAELDRIKASWTGEDEARFAKDSAALKAFQENPDSPEASASLPRLKLSDVPEKGPVPEFSSEKRAGGVNLHRVKSGASGVVHVSLAFPLDGLTREELADFSFVADLFGELDTAKRGATELKNAIDSELGRFSAGVAAIGSKGDGGKPGDGRGYFIVRAAALESKADRIAPLLCEILKETKFDDPERTGDLLTQQRRSMELSAAGIEAKRFATLRSMASVTSAGAISECQGGIFALRRYQSLDDSFEKDGAEICRRFGGLARRIVSAGAESVFASDNTPDGIVDGLLAAFRRVPGPKAAPLPPFPAKREGFAGPGNVASAAKASFSGDTSGSRHVAARILSLDYLWREIRVRGGAYGGGLGAGALGSEQYSSWNDPSPARTLGVYDKSGDALREAVADGKGLESCIIGTVAAMEPYLSPSYTIELAESIALSGRTAEDLLAARREALKTTKDDLLRIARQLDEAAASKSVCVVGGKAQIDACKDLLDAIEPIAAENGTEGDAP